LERIGISTSEVDEGSAAVDTTEMVGSAAQEPKAENSEEGRGEFGDLTPEQAADKV
jgi:hypothetical protein